MEHFKGPRGKIDPFGNGHNTQAHRINDAMSRLPQTLLELSAQCGVANHERIRNHMIYLVNSGYACQIEDKWTLTDKGSILYLK